MAITELKVQHFRNIQSLELQPDAKFNLIHGNNGSGKTSLLEAIHFISTGKSFKTHLSQRIINNQANQLNVFAAVLTKKDIIKLGIQKDQVGKKIIRVDGEPTNSIIQAASNLPLQIIHTQSSRFFHDGPKQRRQFIDWGLFHMKHDYLKLWKSFQKILKLRNSAIKSQRYPQEIQAWDADFINYGSKLSLRRSEYIEELRPSIHKLFTTLLPEMGNIQLNYEPGWNHGQSLAEALAAKLEQDRRYGYTSVGPHRADLQIRVNDTPAQDFLSQGQQKLAIIALSLAQGQLYHISRKQSPIYLIDDLPSELDQSKLAIVCNELKQLNSQVLITAVDTIAISPVLNLNEVPLFHMKHGSLERKSK
jgi:DNA replication and repair protein RecF